MTPLADPVASAELATVSQMTTIRRPSEDLTELATRIITSWPRLSDGHKRGLGRLLAS